MIWVFVGVWCLCLLGVIVYGVVNLILAFFDKSWP